MWYSCIFTYIHIHSYTCTSLSLVHILQDHVLPFFPSWFTSSPQIVLFCFHFLHVWCSHIYSSPLKSTTCLSLCYHYSLVSLCEINLGMRFPFGSVHSELRQAVSATFKNGSTAMPAALSQACLKWKAGGADLHQSSCFCCTEPGIITLSQHFPNSVLRLLSAVQHIRKNSTIK